MSETDTNLKVIGSENKRDQLPALSPITRNRGKTNRTSHQ
ncbi:hypothetical protein HMPREF9103_03049 [Lentilactobacillus parafarraginis F0439]|uniref:Uncharacterized protein n=1 Tax=Lentilactobacillus parafarraginis F0439 TaxID=797515 RepID=G9ZTG5_9LACO|nr:hypothetical protein HMPREF9103_03049 [Lentilactobacillus parafarraginis F0439]